MNMHMIRAFNGIILREFLRFFQQRARFLSALVRPLIWLLVFSAGWRTTNGLAPYPPYPTYIPYEVYMIPGLCAMIQLFNGMQSSLSMIYDREMGSMRVLLTTPLPRWFILVSRLSGGVAVSIVQVYAFLGIAFLFTYFELLELDISLFGHIAVLPALILSGFMLGALGMALSSTIKQLENFAGVMNFVIFPMFFISSALFPLWRIRDLSYLFYQFCQYNPFTYAVELIRFALHGQFYGFGALIVGLTALISLALAIYAYDPARGIKTKPGPKPA
jgi:ABC-2 type transport system permease protein